MHPAVADNRVNFYKLLYADHLVDFDFGDGE